MASASRHLAGCCCAFISPGTRAAPRGWQAACTPSSRSLPSTSCRSLCNPSWCDLLDSLPRLQGLRVCHRTCKIESEALHALFDRLVSAPPPVCPALSQLSLQAKRDADTETRLVAMLFARVALGHPIRRLTIQPYSLRVDAETSHFGYRTTCPRPQSLSRTGGVISSLCARG